MQELDKHQAEHVAGAARLPRRPPVTTMAVGEEGGDLTTLAIGEEEPVITTLALGEEDGGFGSATGGSAFGRF